MFISGYVQGVFFRENTKRKANSLNVTGWVRNLEDGRVEAVFGGGEQEVKSMIEFCKHGPPRAAVTNVGVLWEKYTEAYDGFKISF